MPRVLVRAKVRRKPMTSQQLDAILFCSFLGYGVWTWLTRTAAEEQQRYLRLWVPEGKAS